MAVHNDSGHYDCTHPSSCRARQENQSFLPSDWRGGKKYQI